MNDSGDDDPIVDIIARMRVVMPEFTDEQARELEKQIRRDWGGSRPYIAKDHRRRPHERQRLRKELERKTVVEVERSEGVSRRTLYRLIHKGDADK